MAELKIKTRESGYARGKEMHEKIVRAAFTVLIKEGEAALTLRNIAAVCGMKAGNLRYYFLTKQDLIDELLDGIGNNYEDELRRIADDGALAPWDKLDAIISLICDDLISIETTRIFMSLWSASNFDPELKGRLDNLYRSGRAYIARVVDEIDPRLTGHEVENLSVFMQAMLEGLTVFAGHDREYSARIDSFRTFAQNAMRGLLIYTAADRTSP